MDDAKLKDLAAEKGISVEDLKSLARSVFGTLGGKSGTGDSKRRSDECYRKAVAARNKQRAERRKAKEAALKAQKAKV